VKRDTDDDDMKTEHYIRQSVSRPTAKNQPEIQYINYVYPRQIFDTKNFST